MQNATISIFEDIKRTNQYQQEFWSARQLAKTLDYTDYRNFEKAINRAKESCKNDGQSVQNHFVEDNEMVELGKTASRKIQDLVVQDNFPQFWARLD